MSKIEVDEIDKQSGSTLTLGGSGTAVTLAAGATQSGFGRTGTVDWQTGSIKTSATFSASNGEGYFVDTTSNAITANLPAGSAGAIVSFKDYAQNFQTNNLTVSANGSEKIQGLTIDLILDTKGVAVTLVYADATKGWQLVNSNDVENAVKFVTATGGTVTTVCTNFKVHTFTGPGTFQVTCAGNPAGSSTVDYLVVAGGGGGGSRRGGGSGAGGYRESSGAASGCYSASPLGSGVSALPVSSQSYPITVGGGAAGNAAPGPAQPSTQASQGTPSIFSTITSAGGGFGGNNTPPTQMNGGTGGSGGGGGGQFCAQGGAGNTPPVSPQPQGQNGGNGNTPPYSGGEYGGGGGGAGGVGTAGTGTNAGAGGAGVTSSINSTPTARAGGGGGGSSNSSAPSKGAGGTGGGGAGGYPGSNPGTAGTTNTGGGGGGSGAGHPTVGGNGGSGIVIIRYKFQ
jgi:hypothetical protein